jgi:ABC-type Fe3+ transport system substrate-binding protein
MRCWPRWLGVVATALGALVVVACARPAAPPEAQPAAQPGPPRSAASASTPAGQAGDWDQVVAAARQEGVLVLSTHTGAATYQRLQEQIKQEFPWLEIQATGMRASDFAPRVLAEQKNGQYLWDVHIGPPANMLSTLTPAGALEPLRPWLDALPPDIRDDSKWAGGFEMYADPDRPMTFLTHFSANGGFWVNRAQAPREELSTWDDLLNPRWKDRILVYDPTRANGGSFAFAAALGLKGEDYLRQLAAQARYLETSNQVAEWVAQGRFPVAIGVQEGFVEELQSKGIGRSLEQVGKQDAAYLLANGLEVLKNAPHPNATRVFLRWYLSQEGQDAMAQALMASSRRLDVKSYDPISTPDYANLDQYQLRVGTAQGEALLERAMALAKK